MLVFGGSELIPLLTNEGFDIFNFTSLVMGLPKIDLVPEKDSFEYYDEKSFDIQYANWIMNNDSKFIEFMKIVYPLYCGRNVFIVVNWYDNIENYFYANLNESLMKFIQSRYGYNASIINTVEDYMEQNLYNLESGFSIEGLMNIDMDKYRLTFLLESYGYGEQIIPGFKRLDINSGGY